METEPEGVGEALPERLNDAQAEREPEVLLLPLTDADGVP